MISSTITVHVAEGFSKAMSNHGVIGTWPLRTICGFNMDYGEERNAWYNGQQSLQSDYTQPCTKCFSHPDMPLILLGAI
jgi:hypothetical protein